MLAEAAPSADFDAASIVFTRRRTSSRVILLVSEMRKRAVPVGTVGGGVVRLMRSNAAIYAHKLGAPLQLAGVADRSLQPPRPLGIHQHRRRRTVRHLRRVPRSHRPLRVKDRLQRRQRRG